MDRWWEEGCILKGSVVVYKVEGEMGEGMMGESGVMEQG